MKPLFNKTKLDSLHHLLTMRKETISVAESVTTGLLQLAFGSVKSASDFYQGGITTYNAGQKCRQLNVEPIYAISCNCVSQQVSDEMAINCAEIFCSEWGVGITGYSTPVPESANKLYAFFAIAYKGKIIIHKKITAPEDDPFAIQLFYTNSVVNHLINQL